MNNPKCPTCNRPTNYEEQYFLCDHCERVIGWMVTPQNEKVDSHAWWRERKARERDEKEKAAQAALSQSQDYLNQQPD